MTSGHNWIQAATASGSGGATSLSRRHRSTRRRASLTIRSRVRSRRCCDACTTKASGARLRGSESTLRGWPDLSRRWARAEESSHMRAKLERVIAVVLLGGALLPALLAAWCLRLPGICSTVLAAYVLLVAEITAITTVLSAVRVVTPLGIAVAELLLLALAGSLWLRNNRPPVPSPATARAAVAALARDPVTVTLAAVVAIALIYELMLVLTVPPNNWDSLTYHLARVAAWVNHHGIYWIPHAPTDRIDEFQPIAEQQILFNFVATGKGALFALPQFIGQLAILAAIFVTARRLGYELRLAACAALFFATLPLVALEATTAQNDLVAASLGCAAAAFLFGPTRREVALAGGSAALALGVKLSMALALPTLIALAFLRGRTQFKVFGASAVVGFIALAMWGFVRNAVATGHVLGEGGGRVEHSADPSITGLLLTGYRVPYRFLDSRDSAIGRSRPRPSPH